MLRAQGEAPKAEEPLSKRCKDCASSASAEGQNAPGVKRGKLKKSPSATCVESFTFTYERNFANIIHTRAYVQDARGAQRLPRRCLCAVCPDAADFDVRNCIFVDLDQLVSRLGLAESMPAELRSLLHKDATEREQVCASAFKATLKAGKSILHECLFGGAAPASMAGHEFYKNLQRLSIYLRWLAC